MEAAASVGVADPNRVEALLKKLSARRKKPAPVRTSNDNRKAFTSGSIE